MTRRQLAGDAEIAAAFASGESLRLVLLRRGAPAVAQAIAAIARARGVPVLETSVNDLRRMSRTPAPCDAPGSCSSAALPYAFAISAIAVSRR